MPKDVSSKSGKVAAPKGAKPTTKRNRVPQTPPESPVFAMDDSYIELGSDDEAADDAAEVIHNVKTTGKAKPRGKSHVVTQRKPRPRAPAKSKKALQKTPFRALSISSGNDMPMTVSTEGGTTDATDDGTQRTLVLKVSSSLGFSVANLIKVTDGPHMGLPAVVFRPAKPLELERFPAVVLQIILDYVLAPQGQLDGKINLGMIGGRARAKGYNETRKHRLGIMGVNKALYAQSVPRLYSNLFKFEENATLMNFLCGKPLRIKMYLKNIEITNYKKGLGHTSLSMLADCPSLERIHITNGVAVNCDPVKAAKNFFNDAANLLKSTLGRRNGDAAATLDLIRFGKTRTCFSIKEGDVVRGYTKGEKELFEETLIGLLK